MKTNDDKNTFIKVLEKIPFISHAAKQVNIDKATIYRWLKKDKKFKEKVDEALRIGRSGICDVAESQIIKKVNQGDFRACKFILENNDKRYIRPRSITIIAHSHQKELLSKKQKENIQKILKDV